MPLYFLGIIIRFSSIFLSTRLDQLDKIEWPGALDRTSEKGLPDDGISPIHAWITEPLRAPPSVR